MRLRAVLLGALFFLALSCGRTEGEFTRDSDAPALHGSASIVAGHLAPISADEPQAIESPSFQRHFERLGRIAFPDSILLGNISRVEIDTKGRLLLFERSARGVYLFHADGSLIRQLTADTCHPGFNWSANDAVFSHSGEILTIHGSGQYVYFDEEGHCLGVFSGPYANLRANVYGEDGAIFSYDATGESYFVRRTDMQSGDELRIGERTELSEFLGSIIAGGLVQDASGRLYLGIPTSSQVYVFEPTGTDLGAIGAPPSYFRAIEDDLPEGVSGAEWQQGLMERISSSSIMSRLALLDSDALVLLISNNYEDAETSDRFQGLHVLSTSGETLTDEPILMPRGSLDLGGARDGLLYLITDPVETDSGDWGNQGIDVYRFVR